MHVGEQDPVAAIQRLGGADAAIATAVNPSAFEQAMGSLARGGTLVCVGLPADNGMRVPIFETVLGGLTIRGSIVGTHRDLEETFELHRRGLTRVLRSECRAGRRQRRHRAGARRQRSRAAAGLRSGAGGCRTRSPPARRLPVPDAVGRADRIEVDLCAAGDPARAEQEQRYLKSELHHYGASVPAIRKIVKAALAPARL